MSLACVGSCSLQESRVLILERYANYRGVWTPGIYWTADYGDTNRLYLGVNPGAKYLFSLSAFPRLEDKASNSA